MGYEGIVMTQFSEVARTVAALKYTPYYLYLGCGSHITEEDILEIEGEATALEVVVDCTSSFQSYVSFYFNGVRSETDSISFNWFSPNNYWLDIGFLLGYLFLSIFLLWFCLWKFNYTNT